MNKELAIHGGKAVMDMPPRKSTIGAEELEAVSVVLDEGILSAFRGGQNVRAFEEAFAQYVGTKYAVATTSGTTALHASIAALGLKPGDEVLVPALTFVSTASVALQENLKVVFVDIDEHFCMDTNDLRAKITSKSRVIIPVHLYGHSANMDDINAIAKEHGLTVIEDACQSHGATYNDKKTGSLGDIGCFSFFETKNMTCGEGGMITTSDPELYKQICLRREHGSPRNSQTWYNYKKLGYNYNMTELQGAIGRVQLAKLDRMNKGRQDNAALYATHLKALGLTLPQPAENVVSVFHNYPVLIPKHLRKKRDFIVKALGAEGVPVDVAYPCALYQTELFRERGITGDCPHTEDVTSRLITLFTDSAITKQVVVNTAIAFKKVLDYLENEG